MHMSIGKKGLVNQLGAFEKPRIQVVNAHLGWPILNPKLAIFFHITRIETWTLTFMYFFFKPQHMVYTIINIY